MKKQLLKGTLLLFITMTVASGAARALWPEPRINHFEKTQTIKRLWIADFEDPQMLENMGVWVHNILDSDQGLKMEITFDQSKNGRKVLRLDYDVDSPNPAMVGFWVNLRSQDLSLFDMLHIHLKAADRERFPGNIALQFTDADNHKAAYLISNIPPDWKEYQVPLRKFNRITDWSQIKEFEIIIDDNNAQPKEGSLYVAEIYVSGNVK